MIVFISIFASVSSLVLPEVWNVPPAFCFSIFSLAKLISAFSAILHLSSEIFTDFHFYFSLLKIPETILKLHSSLILSDMKDNKPMIFASILTFLPQHFLSFPSDKKEILQVPPFFLTALLFWVSKYLFDFYTAQI